MQNPLSDLWTAFWSIPHIGGYLSLAWAAYLLGLALWIVLQKREPAATVSWLLGLALLPYVGFLVYYFFGPQRIHRQRRRRLRSRQRVARRIATDGERRATAFERMIERACGLPASSATRIDLLVDGSQTYEALIAAISDARHYVHAEYYIFAADHSGKLILDALIDAANRGVRVRLLLDAIGSGFGIRAGYFRTLQAAGGEVAWFHRLRLWSFWRKPWLNLRSHRKIVSVDGSVGFIGGINITDEEDEKNNRYAYRDLHLRMEGAIVRSLDQVLAEDWAYANERRGGVEDFSNLPPGNPSEGELRVQLITSGPDSDWEAIHRAWVSAIHASQTRLWLATPYFVPGEAALMALTSAALRGVDVRLIVPRQSDSLLATLAARSYFDRLLEAGVEVLEYGPRMLHSKAMLVDDSLAIVGSANFDNRSFRLNFEAACSIQESAFSAELERVMQEDMAQSTAVDRTTFAHRSIWKRLPEAMARLMSPLL